VDYSCITVLHNHPTLQIYPIPITAFSKNEILQLGHQNQSAKEMKDAMALVCMEIRDMSLQECFQQWCHCWQLYMTVGRNAFQVGMQ
jgi:hypothetical protein